VVLGVITIRVDGVGQKGWRDRGGVSSSGSPFGYAEGQDDGKNLQRQGRQQIPFGDDNQKGEGKNKGNGNSNSNSRSLLGMTTRKATATATATADPLRG
jgi:hypothetical protein